MARGHWDSTTKIIQMADWIIDQMKASGLRGRGGAGFRLRGPSCQKAMVAQPIW